MNFIENPIYFTGPSALLAARKPFFPPFRQDGVLKLNYTRSVPLLSPDSQMLLLLLIRLLLVAASAAATLRSFRPNGERRDFNWADKLNWATVRPNKELGALIIFNALKCVEKPHTKNPGAPPEWVWPPHTHTHTRVHIHTMVAGSQFPVFPSRFRVRNRGGSGFPPRHRTAHGQHRQLRLNDQLLI